MSWLALLAGATLMIGSGSVEGVSADDAARIVRSVRDALAERYGDRLSLRLAGSTCIPAQVCFADSDADLLLVVEVTRAVRFAEVSTTLWGRDRTLRQGPVRVLYPMDGTSPRAAADEIAANIYLRAIDPSPPIPLEPSAPPVSKPSNLWWSLGVGSAVALAGLSLVLAVGERSSVGDIVELGRFPEEDAYRASRDRATSQGALSAGLAVASVSVLVLTVCLAILYD